MYRARPSPEFTSGISILLSYGHFDFDFVTNIIEAVVLAIPYHSYQDLAMAVTGLTG